jgi:3-deoxy-manno-octulosonate cytidylyltransferase (CMP-KDO synthetase)
MNKTTQITIMLEIDIKAMVKKIKPIIIIPSRMDASRLPNKPLADLHGTPMVEHVYKRAIEAGVAPVYVATPDQIIIDHIEKIGGKAIRTSESHPTGSDRVFEAVETIDPNHEYNVVINLQGDLPFIEPQSLKNCLIPFEQSDYTDIATIAAIINDSTEITNRNVVKIALELVDGKNHGRALYFSRNPIPSNDDHSFYHHIGVYAYRRDALKKFINLKPSLLEKRENLEQLRALAAGMRIDVALVDQIPHTIDTEEDLVRTREATAG